MLCCDLIGSMILVDLATWVFAMEYTISSDLQVKVKESDMWKAVFRSSTTFILS